MQRIVRVLENEWSAKLKTKVKLSFNSLYAHDLAGRAIAFGTLVQGGMEVVKATSVAGLITDDI